MKDFDPNGAAEENSGIFGLPYDAVESALVIIPIPWEATTSYGGGCSKAPQAIHEASMYVELYDHDLGAFYENGIALVKDDLKISQLNKKAKIVTKKIIKRAGKITSKSDKKRLKIANKLCTEANQEIYRQVSKWIGFNKIVGIVGGDHSISFASIKAHLEVYPDMGVLQIDAHSDLRKAFENLEFSHGSVMFNVLTKTKISRIVQLGVRGMCQEENERIESSSERIFTFFDQSISEKLFSGISWDTLTEEIISKLPKKVYVSLDIDGLDPKLCPGTGTPIPGGIDFQQIRLLLKKITLSGRSIVGFDLVEVSTSKGSDWDANVAAHLLYQLCGWSLESRG